MTDKATQPLSALLQRSIRFLSRSHTHIAVVRLTASYPTFVGNDTGLLRHDSLGARAG